MGKKIAYGPIGVDNGIKATEYFYDNKTIDGKVMNGILTRNVGIEMEMNANVEKVGGANVNNIKEIDKLKIKLSSPIIIGVFYKKLLLHERTKLWIEQKIIINSLCNRIYSWKYWCWDICYPTVYESIQFFIKYYIFMGIYI